MPVLRIAHRGGAASRPENTLCAFAHAIALGADGAELDVHLTRDGHVVVSHDFRLNPELCRDGSGAWLVPPTPRIVELSLQELARYDVGRARAQSEYAYAHAEMIAADGERIPLLAEVIDLARRARQTFWLFIEIKSSLADPTLSAAPETLAEATLAVLQKTGYLDRSVIIGFDWRALLRAKTVEPATKCWFSTWPQSWFREGLPPPEDDPPPSLALAMLRHWARSGTSPWAAGYDAVKYGGALLEAIHAAGADGWFSYAPDATADAIGKAHALGMNAGAWTVNDPAAMRALAANGIDAICTDVPDRLAQLSLALPGRVSR